MVTNTFSEADQRIAEYAEGFRGLKRSFESKLAVETRIIVTRAISKLDKIGTLIRLGTKSILTQPAF